MKSLILTFCFLVTSCVLWADDNSNTLRIEQKIEDAKAFCQDNNLNTDYAIFIDMSIHSGKYRLFVVDLKNDSVLSSGLCSHGCCDHDWGSDQSAEEPTFSNVSESHCSSLGKYKIGKRGWSSWGIHVNYKLHGLEASNSNAYERLIVLHSWSDVPDKELFPAGTPEGWGCPAISNSQLTYIDKLLKMQSEPVLLWVYK